MNTVSNVAIVEHGGHDAGRKRLFDGTHRSRPVEETLALVAPVLDRFGITRVADITGLDAVGIPVFAAYRPNSRSLAVSQGKGITRAAARVSAVMEAVENCHAEYARCLCRIESYSELSRHEHVAPPDRLPLRLDTRFSTTRPIPWTRGFDIAREQDSWVPYELVHMNATVPRVPGSGCFCSGSNGLASGNGVAEAMVHALCEVIERDAISLWQAEGPTRWARTTLDIRTVDDPVCCGLLEKFEAASCGVTVWDVASDAGVPVFYVAVFDDGGHLLRPLPAAYGSGCHPDRRIALSRALTEAAQSRLTVISGARDDLSRERYSQFLSPQALTFRERVLRRKIGESKPFGDVPTVLHSRFNEDIEFLVRRLQSIGCDSVIVVDLSEPNGIASVVRVIVPGMEPPAQSPAAKPGARLRRQLNEHLRIPRTDA
ncbi:MAG: YcaO-like family protein [Vicinamibacterales bacterium]